MPPVERKKIMAVKNTNEKGLIALGKRRRGAKRKGKEQEN